MPAEILEFEPRISETDAEKTSDDVEELALVVPIERAIGRFVMEETEEEQEKTAIAPKPSSSKVDAAANGAMSMEAKAKSSKGSGSSWWPCECCGRASKWGNCTYSGYNKPSLGSELRDAA